MEKYGTESCVEWERWVIGDVVVDAGAAVMSRRCSSGSRVAERSWKRIRLLARAARRLKG